MIVVPRFQKSPFPYAPMPKREVDPVTLGKLAKKHRSISNLAELLEGTVPNLAPSPLLKLSFQQIMHVLAAEKQRDEEPGSPRDSSHSSEESCPEEHPGFVLSDLDLVNFTVSCKPFRQLMLSKKLGRGFRYLAKIRCEEQGVRYTQLEPDRSGRMQVVERTDHMVFNLGFEYMPGYLASLSITTALWDPLYYVLNSQGFPPCKNCGMHCELRGASGIPISTYALVGRTSRKPSQPLILEGDPLYRQNRAKLMANRQRLYRCVNPHCLATLTAMIMNFPLGSIFDACRKATSTAKHRFKALRYQIEAPEKKGDKFGRLRELEFDVEYCDRCGVLGTEEANLAAPDKCGGHCVALKKARAKEGDANWKNGPCLCANCALCGKWPTKCRCEPCGKCKRCAGENCRRCKKRCKCKADYCEDCGNEVCEC